MARKPKNAGPGRFRAALVSWLSGGTIDLTNTDFWNDFYNRQSAAGKVVGVDAALQLSAVWACVRLLAETVSTLPMGFFQRLSDGSRVPAVDHPLYTLLRVRPNSQMTAARFWLSVMASLLLRGNAYVEIKRLGARIVSLEILLPQRMVVKQLTTGDLQYVYSDLDGTQRTLSAAQVMHIRGFGTDGLIGLSPVACAREVLGQATAANEYAAKSFAQGMAASGVLAVTGSLKPEQRDALKKSLATFQGSTNAGKVMVTEEGAKFEQISMSPADAQMLQVLSFDIEEICRWFRVHPTMVGHTDKASSWASSSEQMNQQFLTYTLRFWLENIEQEISGALLTPLERGKFFAEFNVEGLLRADSAARAQFYASALQNGYYNRNDVRTKENLTPFQGGEIFTVQSNMMPLDQLGKAAPAPTPETTGK